MNNLNSILIEGNLVYDPAMAHTPKGTAKCTMTISSNRFYKSENGMEKEVCFVDIVAWAKLAEAAFNIGKKGRGVRVVGRLAQSRWEDAEGKPCSKIYVVAEHIEFRPEFKKENQ